MEVESKPVITQTHLTISCEEHDKEAEEPQDPCPCLGIPKGFPEEVMFPLSTEG